MSTPQRLNHAADSNNDDDDLTPKQRKAEGGTGAAVHAHDGGRQYNPHPQEPLFRSAQLAPRYVEPPFHASDSKPFERSGETSVRLQTHESYQKHNDKTVSAIADELDSPQIRWSDFVFPKMEVYHLVEMNHTTFQKQGLPEVCENLRNGFRLLSIWALPNPKRGSVSCRTLEQVEFVVAFFETRKDSNTVLLEVQRQSGDSYRFARYAQQIIACANGHPIAAVDEELSLPDLEKMDSMVEDTYQQEEEKGSLDDSEPEHPLVMASSIVHELITSDRSDARTLGLESLCVMTDPSKTCLSVAQEISKLILVGICTLSHSQPMSLTISREIVLYLAVIGYWQDRKETTQDDVAEKMRRMMYDYDDEDSMQTDSTMGSDAYLAQQVIANAMDVLILTDLSWSSQFLSAFLVDVRRITGRDFLNSTLEAIKQAGQQPHVAYFAVKTLCALCKALPAVRAEIQMDNSLAVLKHAHKIGSTSHKALESVSGGLLLSLQA